MSLEIGSALSKAGESFAKELLQSAKGVASKSIGKLQAEFGVGFAKYIDRNQNRCRFVKTLLHRIDPIPIEQAYGGDLTDILDQRDRDYCIAALRSR